VRQLCFACLGALVVIWPVRQAVADQVTPAASVELSAEPAPADGPAIRLNGIVTSLDNRPVAGAQVVLRAPIGGHQYTSGLRHNRDVLARTTSDRAGKFDFGRVPVPPRFAELIEQLMRGAGGAELVAWGQGYGVVWANVPRLNSDKAIHVALPAEIQVVGTVRASDGKGVAGVSLTVHGLAKSSSPPSSSFREPGDLNLSLSEVWSASVTDDEGRFTIRHLPPKHRVGIVFAAEKHERRFVCIDTDAQSKLTEIKSEHQERSTPVLHSPIELKLSPAREIVVKVIDHEGQPVDGGAVQVIDAERHMAGWEAVRGGQCPIIPRGNGPMTFQYGADPLEPRLGTVVDVEVTPDANFIVEIRLPPPRWLEGRVIDADTGKGVTGVYVRYAKQTDDPFGNKTDSSIAVSGADGKFMLPVATGSGTVALSFHPVYGYFPPTYGNLIDRKQPVPNTEIEIPALGKVEPVTLKLSRGLAVRGIVRDANGSPIAGALVHGANDDIPYGRSSTTTDEQGRFILGGISPYAATTIIAQTDGGGTHASIAGESTQSWEQTRWVSLDLVLQPGAALHGRVLYGGKPRVGVRMKLQRTLGDNKNRYYPWGEVVTDADGRYRIGGLTAGDGYMFEIYDDEGLLSPDWHHQSPYIQRIPADKPEIELPDVLLVSRGQSLGGMVVDPQGRPVSGITVSASLADGRMLSRPPTGPVPWTKTDEDGRFELSQLPDELIELIAYRANPQGGRIRFPAKARPTLNQQDVRIVLDPKLTDEIEDLDATSRP
jgi:hypothetical protein